MFQGVHAQLFTLGCTVRKHYRHEVNGGELWGNCDNHDNDATSEKSCLFETVNVIHSVMEDGNKTPHVLNPEEQASSKL